MKKVKKSRGIEELKSKYGLMFITPWVIGIVLFFLIPVIQSITYSFSKMTVNSDGSGGITVDIIGISNYRDILVSDPNYTNWLKDAIVAFLYSLPIILLLSLVLAMILNQKFRGRLFFRSLYFLPVIIATGEVITYIFSLTSSDLTSAGVSTSFSTNMVSVEDIVEFLDIDPSIAKYISETIGKIFDLVWSCGIQIVLFLAGLQSVPASLYEASKVEGATKWEEFWFITFPMLSRVTLLVGVFTMVELIVNERAELIENIYGKMIGGMREEASAMMWFYFLIAGIVMGIIVLIYNRFLMRRWATE